MNCEGLRTDLMERQLSMSSIAGAVGGFTRLPLLVIPHRCMIVLQRKRLNSREGVNRAYV